MYVSIIIYITLIYAYFKLIITHSNIRTVLISLSLIDEKKLELTYLPDQCSHEHLTPYL